MINFEALDEYEKPTQKAIPIDTLITWEEMQRLATYKASTVKALTANRGINSNHFFIAQLKCDQCGQLFSVNLSKTAFLKTIADIAKNRQLLCPACAAETRKEQERQMKDEKAEALQRADAEFKENTENYIRIYLNPERSWAQGVPVARKYNTIANQFVDYNKIADTIQEMMYEDFLQTPYWKAVAAKARQGAGYKCQLCGATGVPLIVHHNSYKHHGWEHKYYKTDLIVLCEECHETFHECAEVTDE